MAKQPKRIGLAAAQPLTAKARLMRRLRGNTEARQAHFLKYNLGAATYDADYARTAYEDYLPYLERWVRRAADRNADLLLFPEFCFVPGVLARPDPGIPPNPNARRDAAHLYAWSGGVFTDWLTHWSRATGMLIGAATLTSAKERLYNTGLLADERGRIVLRYQKIHLPADEAEFFTPGRDYTVATTRLGRIGFSICYDIQFPEAAAALAVHGVQIVLHPSAGYTLPDETADMGRNRLRVRASDHFSAWVYASFAPVESGGPGHSCIVAPNGSVLATVPGKRRGLALAPTRIGGKRRWPDDSVKAPDREAVRRSLRRPNTYRCLSANAAT